MFASPSPIGQHTLRFPATLDGFASASEWLGRLLDNELARPKPNPDSLSRIYHELGKVLNQLHEYGEAEAVIRPSAGVLVSTLLMSV